jgi:transcriptional regulator with XRE-family HTH domain
MKTSEKPSRGAKTESEKTELKRLCPGFSLKFSGLAASQKKSIAFLAKALDCSPAHIKGLKNGSGTPSLPLFIRIAKLLEVGLDELACFDGSPRNVKASEPPPEPPHWLRCLMPEPTSPGHQRPADVALRAQGPGRSEESVRCLARGDRPFFLILCSRLRII